MAPWQWTLSSWWTSVAEHVLQVTRTDWGVRFVLDRPQKLNALNGSLVHALMDALDDAEADPDVRVIVLEGAGRAFCSGYDLTEEGLLGEQIGTPGAGEELRQLGVRHRRRVRQQ